MKKIFTITAALATTAVMVSSVFAETTPAMTAAYDATSGKVILTNAPTQSTTTYIVFAPSTPGEDGLETGTVAKGSIKQINQEENSVAEIYVGTLAAGKYQVRLGGEGSVYNALFTVGSPSPSPSPSTDPSPSPSADPEPSPSADPTETPKPTGTPYVLGDANMKRGVTVADATAIQEYKAGSITLEPIAIQAANADQKRGVTVADATAIQEWLAAGKPDTSNIGKTFYFMPQN